jgi:hypothetical protein
MEKASGKFLKGIGKPLENAKYPLPTSQRGGIIAQRLLAKTWQFPSLFYEALLLFTVMKVEEAVKHFKNAQWFFSYFCSFQSYHL